MRIISLNEERENLPFFLHERGALTMSLKIVMLGCIAMFLFNVAVVRFVFNVKNVTDEDLVQRFYPIGKLIDTPFPLFNRKS